MRGLRKAIPIVLLAASLCGLWALTAASLPWQAGKLAAGEVARVSLGQVAALNYVRMGFTKATVRCLPGNPPSWVVGTENGEILRVDNQGGILWRHSLGAGKVSALKASPDGGSVLVGEQSPAATLYCLDAETGKVVWSFSGARGVGSQPRSTPMIPWLDLTDDGTVYAAVYRLGLNEERQRVYYSRLYAFSAAGRPLWQFPADEPLDSWVNHAAIAPGKGPVVFATSAYQIFGRLKYPDTLYWLDSASGQYLRSLYLPATEREGNTAIRSSPFFAADGQSLAAISSDGRGFYYAAAGGLIWQRTVSEAVLLGGAYVNAIGRGAYVLPDGVLFTTINTFNRDNYNLPTPLEHPSNNSLFSFDRQGEFRYQRRFGGNLEDIAFAGPLAAVAIGRNIQTLNYLAHGLKIVRLSDGDILREFPTEGPCQAAALSPDGRYAAAVETPAALDNGKVIGAYTLHIWRLE
jgi:outer membrane protein assembly factor BamB